MYLITSVIKSYNWIYPITFFTCSLQYNILIFVLAEKYFLNFSCAGNKESAET